MNDSVETALLSATPAFPAPTTLLVAFSGGLDSAVLLDTLHRLRERGTLPTALTAAHVHHGLSKNADAWLAFCEDFCASRAIPFRYRRLTLPQAPQTSLEETARRARHAALREMAREAGAEVIVLAHHQDDQAETLFLQLLRGAGPQGLAAMALWKPAERVAGNSPDPALWRPLLEVPRDALLACARQRGLEWVEDESNAETGFRRNFLRHRILPLLEENFPGCRKALSRAAALQAEAAAALADAYREIDETRARFPVDLPWFAALPENAARHALRAALRHAGLRAPSYARLCEMVRQLQNARRDARIELRHGAQCLGVYRGRIMLHTPVAPYRIVWRGEETVVLPQGALRFAQEAGGLSREALDNARETLITSRLPESGHERLQLAANRPRRLLRDLMREAGIPHWARETWPRIYLDGVLAAVPGIGTDVRFAAAEKHSGVAMRFVENFPAPD